MTHSYLTHCTWPQDPPSDKQGFLVAADLTQEWLLPWWWDKYRAFNDHPVAFVDLGLSSGMKQWCKERGHYVHLPIADIFVQEKQEFSTEHVQKWERQYGNHFWDSRAAWFKKPLACLRTPFKKTIWMDLDCEVKGNLDSMFSLKPPKNGLVIAQGYSYSPDDTDVNSGVIIFEKGVPIIEDWAKESLLSNNIYVGDQDILYDLIVKHSIDIQDLPLIYNWSRFSEQNPEAVVIHWHGKYGKSYIIHEMQKSNLKQLSI